jgi:hypothetical protein
VGKLEPSYVIRKYLDAPRIRNLTSYLEVCLAPLCLAPLFDHWSCVDLTSIFLSTWHLFFLV